MVETKSEWAKKEALLAIESHVKHGEKIACVLPCHNLVVATVSNWGGYALSAALAIVAVSEGKFEPSERILDLFMGTEQEAICVLEACISAGAWDGKTGKPGKSVDSFSFEENMKVFRQIRQIVIKFWSLQNNSLNRNDF
mmetsp:Transcript_9438/g.10744  ORF Transcript_9438/g.10744 Transcript_9438/m.10744 type:complete len:140 (-) Transcript_9438:44-463(-)